MGDPGPEIIESAPPAGPEASESTTDENEDDIQFVSEGPLRPVLEYIDLVSSDDEEPSTSHSDENFKHKDHIDHQKDKVALTLARLARHVEVEKQQKEEKNRAFREKLDFQHAHGLQELEFIQGHSETEAARQCVDQWLKMSGLKTINSVKKNSFQSGGRMGRCEKSILCPIMHCNKEFDNGHLLLGHLKRFDHSPCDPTITLRGPLASSFACVVCYEHFVSQQQYRDHLLSKVAAADGHSTGLPPQIIQCFACPSCFLLFSTKDACLKHMSAKNHFHQRFKLGDDKVTAHPVSFPSFAKKLLVSLCKDVPFQVKCVACHQTLRSHMELTAHFSSCSATAQNLADINTHVYQAHRRDTSDEEQQYVIKCGTCTKAFQNTESAQQHFHRKHATFQKPCVAPVGSDRGSTGTFAASASHAEKKLKPTNYTDVEKGAEHDTSCQSIEEDVELPDVDYLRTMTHIVFVDFDNWSNFFGHLPGHLNQGTFIWGFQGGNTNWKPPLSCKVYNYLNRIGCFFLHPRCSKRKDAADFAICMHAGRLDEQLPKQIPFTILSGDQGFLELENQFKKTQRPAHILNPHHLEGDMMCALLNSISDTTKECDSDDNTGVKGTAVEELRSTEDVELEEAIRRSLEEM
ncbi:E3 SUMO-protein ligase ZNF451 isoform X6 [Microtus pennsylvanicus]|uniref:E3 SUMO-protein ligase ZNF451 isoform X6 n=1 Tax=Microtus pennsylvanicus TaxID=10058 RepID=UPI003F6B7118